MNVQIKLSVCHSQFFLNSSCCQIAPFSIGETIKISTDLFMNFQCWLGREEGRRNRHRHRQKQLIMIMQLFSIYNFIKWISHKFKLNWILNFVFFKDFKIFFLIIVEIANFIVIEFFLIMIGLINGRKK